MAKKTKIIELVYDEQCGDCFYNVQGMCKRNPATCPYNQPPKIEEEEEEEECLK